MATPLRPEVALSTVAVLGAGAVGARVARQLVTSDAVDRLYVHVSASRVCVENHKASSGAG